MKTQALIPILYNAHNAYEAPEAIRRVYPLVDSILVIYDGPETDLLNSVQKISRAAENLEIIHHKNPQGKTKAIKDGLKYVCETHNFDALIQIDGDLEQNPEDIPFFIEKLNTADLVIGNRYHRKKLDEHRSGAVCLASGILNYSTGFELTDVLCGFRAFTKELGEIFSERLCSEGYGLEVEEIMLTKIADKKAVNIPLSFAKSQNKYTDAEKILQNLNAILIYTKELGMDKNFVEQLEDIKNKMVRRESFDINFPFLESKIICKYLPNMDAYTFRCR